MSWRKTDVRAMTRRRHWFRYAVGLVLPLELGERGGGSALTARTLLSMGIALNDEIRRLLDGRHFAVLATINPDGGPQTSAMWVGRDGDDVLFSTVAGRRKHRNLERDPRASVTVIDSADPYNYVELRGRVTTMEEDVGRAFDTGLSWKYDGRDPDPDRPGAVRLILRMSVEKATGYAA